MKTRFQLRPWLALLLQAGYWSTAFGVPASVSAQGLPSGVVSTVGDPVITYPGTGAMRIDQKGNLALIQWRSFNIDSGARVDQYAPNASALTIHRVFDPELGASQAVIRGTMTADHRVFIVSPGGVLVGAGAVIDAPSIALSAHDLRADLIDKDYANLRVPISSIGFQASPPVGASATTSVVTVESGATLKAGPQGTVLLVGDQINMAGRLTAGTSGQVVLAAVDSAEVDIGDSGFLTIKGLTPGDGTTTRSVNVSGAIEVEGGATPGQVHVVSDGDVYLAGGASIQAVTGPVQVHLEADANGDGRGQLQLAGYDSSAYYSRLASSPAVAAAAPTSVSSVTINTLGGDVIFNGGAGGAASGVTLSYANIDTRSADGSSAGLFSILSLYTTADAAYQPPAVSVDHTVVHAGSIDIQGFNVDSAGVVLDATTLSAANGVTLRGVSTGRLSGSSIGVDLYSAVQLDGGAGDVTVAGRGNDQGVRIQDLTITTAGAAGQHITLAGQTVLSGNAGLGLAPEGAQAIRIHDETNPSLASSADLIIGGTGGPAAPLALQLGSGSLAPQFNVAGRLNYRPLGVNEAGAITESFGTTIRLEPSTTAGMASSFVLLPEWFNPHVNPNLPMQTVIGSSLHVGQIVVAPDVLDGVSTLTLQNQGIGSGGIVLGRNGVSGPSMGILSLISQGDISQSGPLRAEALNVIVPAGATVALNDPGNRVGRLSLDGAAPTSVSGEAVPAASSTSGIPGYRASTEGADFETLAILTRFVVVGADQPVDPRIAQIAQIKAFELPQAIEELRSGVYMRDQFNRPQICTATSVAAGSLGLDATIEPLALEWVKVRRSPQLSSCSGVRVDSACSAF